jgi:hypothetical protein
MKSNIQATAIQIQRATEHFIKRSKPYFDELEAIINTKKTSAIYDISTDTFMFEKIEDTPIEIALKQKISKIREEIRNNVLKY